MSLNLAQLSPQIGAMAADLSQRRRADQFWLHQACARLETWNTRIVELRDIAIQEQRWLACEPRDPLLATYSFPTLPADVTVCATDGSALNLERHGMAQCHVINTGWATIRYGPNASASLGNEAQLLYRDEDIFAGGSEGVPIEGIIADLKRTLAEQDALLVRVRDVQATHTQPIVALMDGTLLLWSVSNRASDEPVVAELIATFARRLDEFKALGVPIASYISRPNGRELVNLLRIAGCEDSSRSIDSCVAPDGCACDGFSRLTDRQLFDHLVDGERSAVFGSHSPVLRHYGPNGGIDFTYLHTGYEIARLEFPLWVSNDRDALNLLHSVVVDGCRRGRGYPPVLSEAHEQAVIRNHDRDAFLSMVEASLIDSTVPVVLSHKQLSKNRRAV